MHHNPNNSDGGQKRTPTPYGHTSLQHLTPPTLFHQTDGPNTTPSIAPPTLTTVNYYAKAHQEYAPLTGSYPHHPPLKMDSPHNSIYHHHHTSALQSLRSADPISSGEWPGAGSTLRPQYQMDSTGRRYGEDAALWHSFLNESSVRPPSGSGGPSDPITSVVGEPIQCVILQSVPKPHLKETCPRLGPLSPLYVPPDGVSTSQRVAKRKRLTRGTASVVEEDSPESDDGPPDPAVKR